MDDQDDVRPPDQIIRERLIDDDNMIMPPVPPQRRRGRKPKNKSIDLDNNVNDNLNNLSIEDQNQYDDYHAEMYGRVDEETRLAMELSENEYFNKIQSALLEEHLKEVAESIKKERQASLPEFRKRVQRLNYTESDKKIKCLFESAFELYCSSQSESISLNEVDYDLLFDYINSLYTVPLANGRRTAIPELEYNLLQIMFNKN